MRNIIIVQTEEDVDTARKVFGTSHSLRRIGDRQLLVQKAGIIYAEVFNRKYTSHMDVFKGEVELLVQNKKKRKVKI